MSGIPDPASSFDRAGSKGATAERDEQGKFITGNRRSRGRPRGSRSKLAEDVVTDVLDSWRQHGPIVLERLACLDPAKYADFIAKVLPREVKVEHSIMDGLSDEQLEQMLEIAERMAGHGPMISVTPIAVRSALTPPIPDAPPTSAEQRATAQRLALHDQHDALALPYPVGHAVPLADREVERRNIAKLEEESINPEDLF